MEVYRTSNQSNLITIEFFDVRQVGHVPMRCRNPGHDERLLELARDVVAGRQPVVVRLELGRHHALAKILASAQPVQV